MPSRFDVECVREGTAPPLRLVQSKMKQRSHGDEVSRTVPGGGCCQLSPSARTFRGRVADPDRASGSAVCCDPIHATKTDSAHLMILYPQHRHLLRLIRGRLKNGRCMRVLQMIALLSRITVPRAGLPLYPCDDGILVACPPAHCSVHTRGIIILTQAIRRQHKKQVYARMWLHMWLVQGVAEL